MEEVERNHAVDQQILLKMTSERFFLCEIKSEISSIDLLKFRVFNVFSTMDYNSNDERFEQMYQNCMPIH